MYSDYWLKSGYQHGESIRVSAVAGYKIWIDNRGCIVGITVDFEEAYDYHYDLPISEWMKFLTKILGDSNLGNTPKLFRKFLYQNKEKFAFEDALNFYQIKYDKIVFY